MCLGIPSRISEVWDEGGTRMAHVDAAGETRRVCLAYLPDLAVGDY
ncbi:MAG: HypC/HybG/HupF family hydrogenase formation chaperone, partial [Pseudonocardiaceae bacterium]